MGNLWVNCRVVPCTIKVSTVAWCRGIGRDLSIVFHEFTRDEDGEPLAVDNVLVGGNGELTGTIVQPLIIFIQFTSVTPFLQRLSKLVESVGPEVVDSEPEDPHSQQEWILIATRVSNS